jgi:hypothetical protein
VVLPVPEAPAFAKEEKAARRAMLLVKGKEFILSKNNDRMKIQESKVKTE